MNTYKTSTGERVTKRMIDVRVREAKKDKLEMHLEKHGYIFCTECKRNDCVPIDCMHIESVDSCQKNGRAEKAWDLNNIKIVGRRHHQKHDGLDLRFNENKY